MTKIQLKNPIVYGSETISELTFQDLKAKHLRQLPKEMGMEDIFKLASQLTGIVPKAMDELWAEDAFQVIEVINSFFPHSLKTMQDA